MSAPPASELVDACARWGIDGAAEEYEVEPEQVCKWLRGYRGEDLPPSSIDEPFSWCGESISVRPSWRTLWRYWHRHKAGEPVSALSGELGVCDTTLRDWLDRLADAYGDGPAPPPKIRRKPQRSKVVKPREAKPTKLEPTPTPRPDTPHEWQTLQDFATQEGAPKKKQLVYRAASHLPQWEHYERMSFETAGIVPRHGKQNFALRLRPGTTWEAMEDEQREVMR
jgi:transposase-like protein